MSNPKFPLAVFNARNPKNDRSIDSSFPGRWEESDHQFDFNMFSDLYPRYLFPPNHWNSSHPDAHASPFQRLPPEMRAKIMEQIDLEDFEDYVSFLQIDHVNRGLALSGFHRFCPPGMCPLPQLRRFYRFFISTEESDPVLGNEDVVPTRMPEQYQSCNPQIPHQYMSWAIREIFRHFGVIASPILEGHDIHGRADLEARGFYNPLKALGERMFGRYSTHTHIPAPDLQRQSDRIARCSSPLSVELMQNYFSIPEPKLLIVNNFIGFVERFEQFGQRMGFGSGIHPRKSDQYGNPFKEFSSLHDDAFDFIEDTVAEEDAFVPLNRNIGMYNFTGYHLMHIVVRRLEEIPGRKDQMDPNFWERRKAEDWFEDARLRMRALYKFLVEFSFLYRRGYFSI